MHDQRDQPEDQVRLAEVAAVEALAAVCTLRIQSGGRDADEDEGREEVDEQREPPLVPEPRERRAAIDRADQRHHDRREQDEEAPEDERMDEPRDEALEQLPLAEHDDRLVSHSPRDVVEPLHRLSEPDEPCEQERAAREQPARDHEHRRERDR